MRSTSQEVSKTMPTSPDTGIISVQANAEVFGSWRYLIELHKTHTLTRATFDIWAQLPSTKKNKLSFAS
jgi:hypothetical protein